MAIGFNTQDIYETKREREKYLGEWVVIYPQGSNVGSGGRIKYIDREIAILNPKQAMIIDENGGKERGLLERDLQIPIQCAQIDIVGEEYIKNWLKLPLDNGDSKK